MEIMHKMFIAAALVLVIGAAHAGETIHADDPWARAMGDTRALENDQVACLKQRDLDMFLAVQRQPGMEMDFPECTLLLAGTRVVITLLEYQNDRYPFFVYAWVRPVNDTRHYWVKAGVELLEDRSDH